jgi:hypothetical protein
MARYTGYNAGTRSTCNMLVVSMICCPLVHWFRIAELEFCWPASGVWRSNAPAVVKKIANRSICGVSATRSRQHSTYSPLCTPVDPLMHGLKLQHYYKEDEDGQGKRVSVLQGTDPLVAEFISSNETGSRQTMNTCKLTTESHFVPSAINMYYKHPNRFNLNAYSTRFRSHHEMVNTPRIHWHHKITEYSST